MAQKTKTIDNFKGSHWFLSNFYPSELWFEGMFYPTVEHAYQAAKTDSGAERNAIRAAKTPGEAKKLGRRATLRAGWDTMRVSVMRQLLKEKFSNNALRAELLETGLANLVEGNYWNDTFWGVCKGRGENQLGKLLMELRDDISQKKG